jgi:hypothetical protein
MGFWTLKTARVVMTLDRNFDARDQATWASDSRSIRYVETHGGISNIWTLPLTGARPQRLTTFARSIVESLLLKHQLLILNREMPVKQGAGTKKPGKVWPGSKDRQNHPRRPLCSCLHPRSADAPMQRRAMREYLRRPTENTAPQERRTSFVTPVTPRL